MLIMLGLEGRGLIIVVNKARDILCSSYKGLGVYKSMLIKKGGILRFSY